VKKALYFVFLGGFQQDVRAVDVGAHESAGVGNAPVDMRLGREIDYPVNPSTDDFVHKLFVADVSFYELVARILFHALQVVQIARVGQLVVVHHSYVPVFAENVMDEVGAYEPGASGHEYFHKAPPINIFTTTPMIRASVILISVPNK